MRIIKIANSVLVFVTIFATLFVPVNLILLVTIDLFAKVVFGVDLDLMRMHSP